MLAEKQRGFVVAPLRWAQAYGVTLIISPLRVNDAFVAKVSQTIAARIGMLIIDRAHCISDGA